MPADASAPARQRLRVFLVENNDDTRNTMTQLITLMGCEALSAATMAEALERLPGADADVLVSDIGLPDGDGWELLRRLEGLSRRPYAVAMSGYGMAEDRERSLKAGYRHHLVKPMDIERLEALLEEAARERFGA